MNKLKWAVFMALVLFLASCNNGGTPALGVSLKATPPTLTAPGEVTLEATVTNGPADQVEFFNGTTSINVDTTAPYSFKIASLAATATFKAVAKKGSATATSANVPVTVGTSAVLFTLAASPNPLPATGAPVTLTTTFTSGQDKVKSVSFAVKGQAAQLGADTDGTNGYSFTTATVTTATTFVATAKDAAGASLGTAEVAVTVGTGNPPGSGATVNATTLAQINGAPENANIVVQNNIACTQNDFQGGDPCIILKPGQKLAAKTAGIKISTDLPGGPGVPGNSDDTAKVTPVRMNNNTAVEGFTFDGTDIYRAITTNLEKDDSKPAIPVTGNVFITNVTITAPTEKAPLVLISTGEVTITNLRVTTTKDISILGFTKATLTGLNLTINRPVAATGAALNIQSSIANSEVILDGLDLKTNLGGLNKDGVIIQPDDAVKPGGNMKATVKNSKVTFPVANVGDSIAFNFNVGTLGGKTEIQAGSTGNLTNSTFGDRVTYDRGAGTDVTGSIEIATTPAAP